MSELAYTGAFRVYFNSKADAPRVWCLSSLDRKWEVSVAELHFIGHVIDVSRYVPGQPGQGPTAWFEGRGVVAIDENGVAVITPPKS